MITSLDSNSLPVAITEVNCKFGGSKTYRLTLMDSKVYKYSSQHGVYIFVKSDLQAYKDDALSSSSFLESVWCRISLRTVYYLL